MVEGRSEVRLATVFDFLQVLTQPAHDVLLLSISHLLQHFVEGEVNHVVMLQFFGRHSAAEFEPDTVQEVDFLGREGATAKQLFCTTTCSMASGRTPEGPVGRCFRDLARLAVRV